ncbi:MULTISPECIES: TnsA endonuclease N-terminal domain-containing protein [unclassified Vibrio]|uniref:TnsA endonuclease N-terminal domain-containing protein n=1 Tax=unclassified Vibrio TaxID=2614977 RepID=UPI001561F713|nr:MULTISPECIES: TnsA endonuclease N-terminal domain-containing protein [unclassified Vibrio]
MSIAFESSLERDFVALLDASDDVREIEEQPVQIKYKVSNENSFRTYTPDTLYTLKSGEKVLCEVKYRKDLFEHWDTLKPKFKAAIRYAKEKGWTFKIFTEKEIQCVWLSNMKFLFRFNSINPEPTQISSILSAIESVRHCEIRELLPILSASKQTQAEYFPIIWNLILKKDIQCDLNKPLTSATEIWVNITENV